MSAAECDRLTPRPASRSRSRLVINARLSSRWAAGFAPTRSRVTRLLDGYRADENAQSGRGQVLIPWPNRIQDGHTSSTDAGTSCRSMNRTGERDPWTGAPGCLADGEREASRVVMEHVVDPQPGYPFSLALGIDYCSPTKAFPCDDRDEHRNRPLPLRLRAHPYLTLGNATIDTVGCRRRLGRVLIPTSAGSRRLRAR